MLTGSELALLSPLFGFLGVLAGGWLSHDATWRQQQIDLNQRRHDKLAAVYEQILVELNRLQWRQGDHLAGAPSPQRDEQAREADALWRAQAAIHGSKAVREAYRNWTGVWTMRWETIPGGTPEEQAAAHQRWLPQMSAAHLEVAKAMRDDLEALNAMPGRARWWRWSRKS